MRMAAKSKVVGWSSRCVGSRMIKGLEHESVWRGSLYVPLFNGCARLSGHRVDIAAGEMKIEVICTWN
jgi:hypothetical protein